MKITPIEIRQKQFEKRTFGGIDKDEVAAYLNALSNAWEKNQDEVRELKERINKQDQEVSKLREIESSLYKTLKTAEETGSNMVEQARQKSGLQMREAELKAEALLKEARWQAKNMVEEARQEARKTLNMVQEEMNRMEQEARGIEGYRDNLLSELRIISSDIAERAARYQERSKGVDFKRSAIRMPDMLSSPDFEAAMSEATLAGPANATPAEADGTAAEQAQGETNQSFFDTVQG